MIEGFWIPNSSEDETQMELTPQESKMLADMRKRQVQWPNVRWLQVTIGLGSVVAFSFLFRRASDFLMESPVLGLAVFAGIAPMIMLGMFIGSYKVAYALLLWHGNPERTLLLKLFDELEGRNQHRSKPVSRGAAAIPGKADSQRGHE